MTPCSPQCCAPGCRPAVQQQGQRAALWWLAQGMLASTHCTIPTSLAGELHKQRCASSSGLQLRLSLVSSVYSHSSASRQAASHLAILGDQHCAVLPHAGTLQGYWPIRAASESAWHHMGSRQAVEPIPAHGIYHHSPSSARANPHNMTTPPPASQARVGLTPHPTPSLTRKATMLGSLQALRMATSRRNSFSAMYRVSGPDCTTEKGGHGEGRAVSVGGPAARR